MRRLKFFFTAFIFLIFFVFGGNGITVFAQEREFYIGGIAAGFMMGAGGAQVIGFNDVVAEEGVFRPAADAGIRSGDLIVSIDGVKTEDIATLNRILNMSGGKCVTLRVKRSGEYAEVSLQAVKEKKSGNYKIGVLVRDTVSGIGTVTYIEKDTLKFGALGHSVTDGNAALSPNDCKVYLCSVIGVNKGVRGKAGELRGLFVNDNPIAQAETLNNCGLYGTFDRDYDFSKLDLYQAASIGEAKIGKAEIYSTIDGVQPQKFDIAIAKVDAGNRENKNFVIKITDERLISETGGIVQGMSGSPIVQNGKLIGAVTHVFINDPTRGYGIAIENMIGE